MSEEPFQQIQICVKGSDGPGWDLREVWRELDTVCHGSAGGSHEKITRLVMFLKLLVKTIHECSYQFHLNLAGEKLSK